MGFWNVQAKDLRKGDEIRVRVMGGEEFLTVLDVDRINDANMRVHLSWGFHVPREPFWDELDPNEKMTVRR